jgi:hypothetical protein
MAGTIRGGGHVVARKQAQHTREIRLDDPAAAAPPTPSGDALRRYRQISRGLMATDAACLVIALLVGYYLRYDNRPMPTGESLTVLFAPLLWLAAFQAFGLYAPQHLSPPEEFRRIFGAASVGIVLLVVASYWSHSDFSSWPPRPSPSRTSPGSPRRPARKASRSGSRPTCRAC